MHADDVHALMDALKVEKAGIVGHDVGAYVMQFFARKYPERSDRPVLLRLPDAGSRQTLDRAQPSEGNRYQSFHQKDFAAKLVGESRETCRTYFAYFLAHWSHDPATFDDELETWVDNFMQPGNLQGGFNYYLSANAGRLAAMRGETGPAGEDHDAYARVVGPA